MNYAVIMSGGMGTRFWPKSRHSFPKQFLKTVGNKTMIQNTFERIEKCINRENICVVTNKNYIKTIKRQLPMIKTENIFIEPYNKETATCIGLSALRLLKKDKDAVVVVLPSDHMILNIDEFEKTVDAGIKHAESCDMLVTFGIIPRGAETAYGYIEIGKPISIINNITIFNAKRFTEKPNKTVAQIFVDKGTFLWNSGMFVFKAATLIKEIKMYLPDLYSSLIIMEKAIGANNENKVIEEEYSKIDGISIDFGIMEKSLNIAVLKTKLEWDDIGSWNTLEKYYLKDDDGNIINGLCTSIDTKNCIIFGDSRLIATIGINNLLIVDTGDTLLICDRERDQDIKGMVKQIENTRGFEKFV